MLECACVWICLLAVGVLLGKGGRLISEIRNMKKCGVDIANLCKK